MYVQVRKSTGTYLLGSPVALSDLLAIVQPGQDLLDGCLLFFCLLCLETLPALASSLLLVLERLFDKFNVLESQLVADDVEVSRRVDVAFDVDDLGVIKTPHDLEDSIDGTDMGQEGIPKPGASGGTTRQASDVVYGKIGGHSGLGVVLLAEPVEPGVRNDNSCFLGVDGGIRKILNLHIRTAPRKRHGQ